MSRDAAKCSRIHCFSDHSSKARARERFLVFALDPNNPWSGNFRDLNAMVVRMATLADGGRKLFAVSFKTKTSSNSTDRLSKYLARFGLKFRDIIRTSQSPITTYT